MTNQALTLFPFPVPIKTPINPTRRQAKHAAKLSSCLVCQDKARIINYGALSCSSCKTFFRRHGFRVEKVEPCRFDGNCNVTLRARRTCAACRLAKCLSVGMSPDLIRKEDLSDRNLNSAAKINQSQQHSLVVYPLNLLNENRSNLTTIDWTLLSNIIHAYDMLSPARSTRDQIVRQSTLPLKIRLKSAQELIPNLVFSFYTSLQSYIHCIDEYRRLSCEQQICLYQRNFQSISSLTGQLILRESGLLENETYMSVFASHFDPETLFQAASVMKRLDSDSNLVKIFLIVLSFSSNCFFVHENEQFSTDKLLRKTQLLFQYQNLYVELLWKYMVYRYGDREAPIRFLGLTKQILDLIPLTVKTYVENSAHQSMMINLTQRIQFIEMN